MDVKTMCLGVLTLRDASGYEIRKMFEEGPFAHFHEAGFGSIYPALKKLHEEGLVTVTAAQQTSRPDKKVYRITDEGMAVFRKALQRLPEPDHMRSEFTFMLFFGHLMVPGHLEVVIADRLAWLRKTVAEMDAATCESPPPAGARFIHGMGLAIYRTCIDYLEEHKHELIGAAIADQKAAE
ncbi:MAG TPA: PadR family transcriptional regulator [Azospirillaceae bacterium]|nr:PadR family transcriptional regulator [Azospirillaceae bacterium]